MDDQVTGIHSSGGSLSGGGSFATPLDDTNALMYASRMQYLHEDESKDRTRPDTLFLSRRQAHKQSAYNNTAAVNGGKKLLDHRHHHHHNLNRRVSVKNSSAAGQQHSLELSWKPVFQAGCHFFQNTITGECIVDDSKGTSPCPFHAENEPCEWNGEEEDDGDAEIVPFPPTFQFLDANVTGKSKSKGINQTVHHIVMRKSER